MTPAENTAYVEAQTPAYQAGWKHGIDDGGCEPDCQTEWAEYGRLDGRSGRKATYNFHWVSYQLDTDEYAPTDYHAYKEWERGFIDACTWRQQDLELLAAYRRAHAEEAA